MDTASRLLGIQAAVRRSRPGSEYGGPPYRSLERLPGIQSAVRLPRALVSVFRSTSGYDGLDTLTVERRIQIRSNSSVSRAPYACHEPPSRYSGRLLDTMDWIRLRWTGVSGFGATHRYSERRKDLQIDVPVSRASYRPSERTSRAQDAAPAPSPVCAASQASFSGLRTARMAVIRSASLEKMNTVSSQPHFPCPPERNRRH
jgi:hypothetical protein